MPGISSLSLAFTVSTLNDAHLCTTLGAFPQALNLPRCFAPVVREIASLKGLACVLFSGIQVTVQNHF
jgi:hypothetical protein